MWHLCYLCIVDKTKEFFKFMKYNQLYKELRKAGCLLTQHGAEHDEWSNPSTGAKIRIPRHGSHEVKTGLLKKIYKVLLGR